MPLLVRIGNLLLYLGATISSSLVIESESMQAGDGIDVENHIREHVTSDNNHRAADGIVKGGEVPPGHGGLQAGVEFLKLDDSAFWSRFLVDSYHLRTMSRWKPPSVPNRDHQPETLLSEGPTSRPTKMPVAQATPTSSTSVASLSSPQSLTTSPSINTPDHPTEALSSEGYLFKTTKVPAVEETAGSAPQSPPQSLKASSSPHTTDPETKTSMSEGPTSKPIEIQAAQAKASSTASQSSLQPLKTSPSYKPFNGATDAPTTPPSHQPSHTAIEMLQPDDSPTEKIKVGTTPSQESTKSLDIQSKSMDIIIDTKPPGLYIIANGDKITTPAAIETRENHEFTVEAPTQTMDGISYALGSWSDGGSETHVYVVPAAYHEPPEPLVANFEVLNLPKIHSPMMETRLAVGDSLILFGSATDEEGTELPDSSLTWEARLYNKKDDKYRTILTKTRGNNIELDAPQPKDFSEAETSYLEVLLTATIDASGFLSKTSLLLEPRKVNLAFETDPPGLNLTANGEFLKTPAAVTSWCNHKFTIEAPTQKKKLQSTYGWQSWSDGGDASHEYVVPPAKKDGGPHTILAVFDEQRLGQPRKVSFKSKKGPIFMGTFIGVVVVGALVIRLLGKKKVGNADIADTLDDSKWNESADVDIVV